MFDCNFTSHQSGTEEFDEKRMRAYLGNIQRIVSVNRSTSGGVGTGGSQFQLIQGM